MNPYEPPQVASQTEFVWLDSDQRIRIVLTIFGLLILAAAIYDYINYVNRPPITPYFPEYNSWQTFEER